MGRLLYCRFDDCREAFLSEAGKVPSVCPACGRSAQWSTEPPPGYPTPLLPDDPKKPYRLSRRDRLFLKSIRVEPTDESDRDDGA